MDNVIDAKFKVVRPIYAEAVVKRGAFWIMVAITTAITSMLPIQRTAAWAIYDHNPAHFSAWVHHAEWTGERWIIAPSIPVVQPSADGSPVALPRER